MTRGKRYGNLVAVLIGFFAFGAAIVAAWHRLVAPTDLVILAVAYVMTGLGITIGYHRLIAHRAFRASRPVEYLFAILGSLALQGPVIEWVTEHRKHHAHSDQPGDPHSPHVDPDGGLRGALRGLYHAHVGWVFRNQGDADPRQYAPDLLADRGMWLIDRGFGALMLVSLGLPFAIGWAVTGDVRGGWTALLWGGLVRVFLLHHVTFSINSICHYVGARRFPTRDQSRNVFWLALPSFGEAWHHNHHAFPRSAAHGLQWWEVDLSYLVIRGMRAIGIAHDVVEVTRERQARRADRAVKPARGGS